MNVTCYRDTCAGNSRVAALSSRFVGIIVSSGCAVDEMLHKEKPLVVRETVDL